MEKEYGVFVTTDDKISVFQFKDGDMSQQLRAAVGGWIEHVSIAAVEERKICIIINEEGRLLQLPLNFIGTILYGDFIHGNIVVCKDGYRDGEADIVGFTEQEAEVVESVFNELIKALKKVKTNSDDVEDEE